VAAKDVVVKLQTLDGSWEHCGTDRNRGIHPENVTCSANDWGSDQASFDLRRDPGQQWPDLSAFTPVDIEIGGVLVWAGRVKETPTRDTFDKVITVTCEGWQYHLDDDVYEKAYVHTKLADWKDQRSFPGANLTYTKANSQVSSDNGSVMVTWPNGAPIAVGDGMGVTLDLGPYSAWVRVVVQWDRIGPVDGNWVFAIRGGDTDDMSTGSGLEDISTISFATAGGITGGTFGTGPKRYIHLMVYRQSTAGTATFDQGIRVNWARVFPDAAFESGNVSVLKAPVVIADALNRVAPLISPDRSMLDPDNTITFSIPELAPGEPRTPREMWDAVNAYHDYQSKIDVQRRPVFIPRPSRPELEVGAWSPMESEDASANSGAEIYNRVVVTATAPNGQRLVVPRATVGLPDNVRDLLGQNVITWTWNGTTGSSSGAGGLPAVQVGRSYLITIKPGPSFPNYTSATQTLTVTAGTAIDYVTQTFTAPTSVEYSLIWEPREDYATSVALVDVIGWNTGPGANGAMTIEISQTGSSIPDRRGFRRAKVLQVQASMPSDGIAMRQIGDTWLTGHQITPFKGSAKLTGPTAVRRVQGGSYLPLEQLLLRTGELLRFGDRVDPGDGSVGRDSRIASVSYVAARDEATVAMDNTRAGFEALLARMAVVAGGG
jgi:hypothetical protein